MKRAVVPGTKGRSRQTGNVRKPCSCWGCSYSGPKIDETIDWMDDGWDWSDA